MSTTTTTTTTTNLPHHVKPKQASPESKPPTFKLSQKTILHILNSKCTTSLQNLKQAHGVVLRSGHFQDHYVAGTILKCYASSNFNNFGFALKVFDNVWKPNVFVWNIMIKGCVENYEALKSISFYYKMVDMNSRPNKFTYPMLFKACRLVQAVEEGLQIHAHVVKQQLSEDGHIRSAGIQMYASFGLVEEARRILLEDAASDVVCWNAMIDGYIKCGDVEAAKELFEHMPSKNVGSWNAMVSGFARCGRLKDARGLFDSMTERDEISWSAMIDGYVQGGYHKEALEVFNEMQKEKIASPSKFVLSSVLAACANVGALDQGKWVHGYIKKNSIQVDAVLGTALVDMYAKCGRLDMAWEVFENVKRKEVSTWNAMIGGLAMHGRADDALDVFFKMQGKNLEPNGITFLNALSACAHGEFVDEGLTIFSSMKEMYGMEAEVEHYGCVVDMFGRAGLLEEAEQVINSMPIEPSAAVYGALLGACRIHGNVEMGERVGRILLELEPQNGGRYALLSNIYAEAGMWDDVAEVRKLMKERGVKTNPGISMVDIGGKVHEFKMGEGSHPQMKEVYLMLEKIIEKLEMEGYSPNTSEVLFDIAEEEKETALRYHSEKLAIAFGVLKTKPGTTIRVVKNLRICEDCHSAIKLFSQLDNRDIIVRDRMRYHHFRNGRCSCKDFW
ncbi:PREDICTED: pentatricopeptide repeat-containing protein At5g66520-like [Fragaria vesca subsp. vesca]|uniref:pentatricopeptide repeat-containing protein At5g66520-like n=1 Tax=Fragaria vesca subsp. vesca TaxID=101020 RepID=UPI0002C2EB04|nr:PREDICTED: pentatricopeptide repeat-containing protein At5g66520-like [Fragaria vesca subsp. vesca]